MRGVRPLPTGRFPIPTYSTDELRHLIDLLQHHCLLGQLHYRSWQRLNASFQTLPQVGNQAPIFFLYTADAHLNSALLILNRLIDKRRDVLSLRRFLDHCEASAGNFTSSTVGIVHEAVASDRRRLQGLEETAGRIRDHRNEQFVHLSETLIRGQPDVAQRQDSFTYAQIGQLLVEIGEILNRYSTFLSGSTMLMQVFGEDLELPYLLDLIQRGAQALDTDQMNDT